ncbi:MAG: ATP-binding protein [Candidatus Asgardarchaeia archaeon]
MKEVLISWNPWWNHDTWIQEWVPRTDYVEKCIDFLKKKIVVLYGVRRSGKTVIMFQIIRKLIENKVDSKNILYLNFDDERLPNDLAGLDKIYNEYLELTGAKEPIYIFLDEVQRVTGWSSWVRRFHDMKKPVYFLVSGSSSSILKPEIAQVLTGRRFDIAVWPFSFKEYLAAQNVYINDEDPYIKFGSEPGRINHLLLKYMKTGGFPEVVTEKIEMMRLQYLHSYFLDIIYRDIVGRYNNINVSKLRDVALFMIENISNPINISKLSKYIDISKPTLYQYLAYLEEVFMFFFVEYFSFGAKKRLLKPRKVYLIDVGLYNALSRAPSSNYGRIEENLVYLHIKRFTDRIYYWQDEKGREIDFVAEINGKLYAIESKFDDVKHDNTLINFAETYSAIPILVTKSTIGKRRIPLWLFLLTTPDEWSKYASFS